MADTVGTTYSLQIENYFVDGDTRTFNVPNPNTASNLSEKISALNTFMQAKNAIIGDKYGSTFGRITKATTVTTTTTKVEID